MRLSCCLLLAGLGVAGCAEDFAPYEDVQEPRLLAIAADLSELVPDDQAVLSALVSDDSATYRWSWCPLAGTSAQGYPCLVEEAQLQAVLDDTLGPGQVTVPPFDLGTEPTATLTHAIPPEVYQAFCQASRDTPLPPGIELPACDEYWDATIRVEMTAGATTIVGVRDVRLLYSDAVPANQTPVIGAVSAVSPTGETIALDDVGSAELSRDVEYELVIDVPAASIESYQRVPVEGGPAETVEERIRITWFHEGGEMDRAATGTSNTTSLDDARRNTWTTPTLEDRPEDTARLFLVLRDDRGGTTWTVKSVRLTP